MARPALRAFILCQHELEVGKRISTHDWVKRKNCARGGT